MRWMNIIYTVIYLKYTENIEILNLEWVVRNLYLINRLRSNHTLRLLDVLLVKESISLLKNLNHLSMRVG